ncbi:hypothetical protein IFM89_026432 [Coptis chinensis]|uniref:Pentatricopeptide repeat-containing protein n=1 Tax=Coptis chinensis TaxID=261450 RepID=A0A835HK86_9MAGN|nr:hypothetical protein IFM89_026432 [Coptis chinensis]
MQEEGVLPNEITMMSLVLECGFSGALELGRQLHNYMLRRGFNMSLALSTALVDMGKSLDQAFDLFVQMRDTGMKPNEVTVVNLLSLCAEAGALDLGKWIHAYIYLFTA